MALDTRGDRLLWGIGNLAIGALCIPFCYGLSKDFTSFKFLSAAGGIAAGLNSVRLFHEHESNADLRSAWRASAQMVSGAWIEEIASANLPPSFQPPVYQPEFARVENLPPLPAQLAYGDSRTQFAAPPPETENLPDRGDGRTKMPNLSAYPSVLIYGPQGSGKTTFAQEEVQNRLALGHQVVVLDPHAAYGAWKGCEIVGGGMNYEAIDRKLKWLFQEIKDRYQRIETEPSPKFDLLTVTAEEFTRWSVKVKSSSEFFWTALTDIRKVGVHILFVSHTRTLIAVGGAKGSAELRDEGLLEVHLLAEKDEKTNKAFPKFEAWVKLPGDAGNRFLVKLERHSNKLPLPSPEASEDLPGSFIKGTVREPKMPGSPLGMPGIDLEATLGHILGSDGKYTVFAWDWGANHAERFELARLVIAQNLGIEKTILHLWGVKSGGRTHQKYIEARGYLDRLIAQINNNR